jgi:uncharacterized membrane protein (UPF0127 family)
MMRLMKNGGGTLIENLEEAATMWSRLRGLLGRDSLAEDSGLWIRRCNSVHTFFMRFPLDLVFVDRDLVVRKTVAGVRPGRVVPPVWRADSVIELREGFLRRHPLAIGERLYVDPALS